MKAVCWKAMLFESIARDCKFKLNIYSRTRTGGPAAARGQPPPYKSKVLTMLVSDISCPLLPVNMFSRFAVAVVLHAIVLSVSG